MATKPTAETKAPASNRKGASAESLAPVKLRPSSMAKLYREGATLIQLAGKTHMSVPAVREALVASGVTIRQKGGIRSSDTNKRAARMTALYKEGKTLQEIGDEFEITRERVRQVLRKAGVDSLGRRDHKPNPDSLTAQQKKIARLYDTGTSPIKIRREYGITYTKLQSILFHAGIEIKPKGFFNRRPGYDKIHKGVIQDYLKGDDTQKIADRYGLCGPTEIYKFIKREGIEVRSESQNND